MIPNFVIIVGILIIGLFIINTIYALIAIFLNDNDWLEHLIDKTIKYWFEPVEKDLLDIKPASFVDFDGERVYVTSDREVFYGYYPAKEHEEDILLKMYLDYGLIDKRTAGRRDVTTRIWIKENSRFKKWLYNSKLKASPTIYLLE